MKNVSDLSAMESQAHIVYYHSGQYGDTRHTPIKVFADPAAAKVYHDRLWSLHSAAVTFYRSKCPLLVSGAFFKDIPDEEFENEYEYHLKYQIWEDSRYSVEPIKFVN